MALLFVLFVLIGLLPLVLLTFMVVLLLCGGAAFVRCCLLCSQSSS